MMIKAKELLEEMRSVVSGKTFDAILPPLLFVMFNGLFGLDIAAMISIGLALVLAFYRMSVKQNWYYALGGFLGVAFAVGLAYLTNNAANYFIPTVISSALLLALALVTIFIGKPLAAWGSHLSRGWPLDWFWRKDVKPAYREVTWLWAGFFSYV